LPFLLAPAVTLAQAMPAPKVERPQEGRYRCYVERTLSGGTVSLIRLYTIAGVLDTGDIMRWEPRGYDPGQPHRPLGITLSYLWHISEQPKLDLRQIDVHVTVQIDADLPEISAIEIKRPFPIKPYGVIGSTALSTQVFPNSTTDRRRGHGEIPLGDLLAYAEEYATLDWRLVRPSDRLGGQVELAQGTIDIAALRDAIAALPTLRSALATQAAHPRKDCEPVSWPTLAIP
jgi:hypothetical protein